MAEFKSKTQMLPVDVPQKQLANVQFTNPLEGITKKISSSALDIRTQKLKELKAEKAATQNQQAANVIASVVENTEKTRLEFLKNNGTMSKEEAGMIQAGAKAQLIRALGEVGLTPSAISSGVSLFNNTVVKYGESKREVKDINFAEITGAYGNKEIVSTTWAEKAEFITKDLGPKDPKTATLIYSSLIENGIKDKNGKVLLDREQALRMYNAYIQSVSDTNAIAAQNLHNEALLGRYKPTKLAEIYSYSDLILAGMLKEGYFDPMNHSPSEVEGIYKNRLTNYFKNSLQDFKVDEPLKASIMLWGIEEVSKIAKDTVSTQFAISGGDSEAMKNYRERQMAQMVVKKTGNLEAIQDDIRMVMGRIASERRTGFDLSGEWSTQSLLASGVDYESIRKGEDLKSPSDVSYYLLSNLIKQGSLYESEASLRVATPDTPEFNNNLGDILNHAVNFSELAKNDRADLSVDPKAMSLTLGKILSNGELVKSIREKDPRIVEKLHGIKLFSDGLIRRHVDPDGTRGILKNIEDTINKTIKASVFKEPIEQKPLGDTVIDATPETSAQDQAMIDAAQAGQNITGR